VFFDVDAVKRAVDFIECLTLTKSTRSQKPEPFKLLPHSLKIVSNVYGWRKPNGHRVIEKVFASFGRKQAKTQTAAAIATYEFFMGDEPMQEIYFAATAADQAAVCYKAVLDMILAEPTLAAACKITDSVRKIVNVQNGNELKVLSADGKKQHGLNPSLVIFDELHAWGAPEAELFDALTTGSMSRANPLWLTITTAGTDRETICGREYEYAKRVQSGEVTDPSYLPIIYEVPADADWTDKTLWPMALPLLQTGHHDISRYESEFQKALQQPSEQNKFRRLYLNQWTSAETQWIPIKIWDECAVEVPDEDLMGVPCWGGLDLGASNDFTAFTLAFKLADDRVVLRSWAYVPGSTLAERAKRDGMNYQSWVDRGWMRTTAGATTDYDEVFDHIEALAGRYDVQAIAFDRWRIKYIEKRAEEAGIKLIEWGQGFRDMSPAIEIFERLAYNQQIAHDGNAALRWNMDCSTVKSDPAGNKKLVKPPIYQRSKHIDMAVSAVMAVGASMLIEGEYDPYANGATAVVV
jgi:phage terminase large subunit-like protein